ncbi:hypothetical protein EJB05_57838 [Eragrostis curvula]|uniref:BURP domain-containing protein n=1 Tax=Eragrostis curvula TaxID=38414 RepID=A0A5J9SC95_9POAL|nr:hypothetical protein EJB05_57836 [Eragrostis curvula]TVT96917.1 hypothetical protein EJB05_57838 [Eragrostis curvula]
MYGRVMRPSVVLLFVLVAGCAAVGVHAAAGTPAARFWEAALPGSPMPEAVADLVQEGIDHSPLVEHFPVRDNLESDNNGWGKPPHAARERSWADGPTSTGLPGYFFQTQVRVGSTMTVFFPPAAAPPILPLEVAEKVPFSNLADVLSTFDIAPGSAAAATVRKSLSECQAQPDAGDVKSCTSSLEATVQSAMRMLGTSHDVWASASALTGAGLPRQAYVVQAAATLDGDRHVGCHAVSYPYAVYLCHMTGTPTKAYKMTLRGLRGGSTVDMTAICHLDTSNWSPSHPAMKILHTQPGAAPVCHFMAPVNLVFGKKTSNAYASE